MVAKVSDKLQSAPQANGAAALPPSVGARAGRPSAGSKPRPASAASRPASAASGTRSARGGRSKQPTGPSKAKARAAGGGLVAGQPKPRAAKPEAAASADNDSSNLELILQGLTLKDAPVEDEATRGGAQHEADEEEDMDFEGRLSNEDEDEEEEVQEEEAEEEEEAEKCAICLDEMDNPKKLDKCGHIFCSECIEGSFRHHKPACPTCNTLYGLITGTQPRGTMDVSRKSLGLPGYQNCGLIVIDYRFSPGTQGVRLVNGLGRL